jgi:hypothetical protein
LNAIFKPFLEKVLYFHAKLFFAVSFAMILQSIIFKEPNVKPNTKIEGLWKKTRQTVGKKFSPKR